MEPHKPGQRPMAVRPALNLAELVAAGHIEITDVVLADAATLIAAEIDMLSAIGSYLDSTASSRAHLATLLGYDVEPHTGDLNDFVERRLVTEYLLSMGIDVRVIPMSKESPLYSHVARDASLVAIAGEIAPQAIVQRLTTCPRLFLYGTRGDGLALGGTLFRRTVTTSHPAWPSAANPEATRQAIDLPAMLRKLEEGVPVYTPPAPVISPAPASTPFPAPRRRIRHTPLKSDGDTT